MRAREILNGIRDAITRELQASNLSHGNYYERLKRFEPNIVKDHFENDCERTIAAMIEVMLNELQKEELNSEVGVFDPFKRNDKSFWDGRMEWNEIEGENMAVVSVGGYLGIRRGSAGAIAKLEGDQRLNSRCSKLTESHTLAAKGKMFLPAGVYPDKLCAALPIPPNRFQFNMKPDNRKFMPISLLKRF